MDKLASQFACGAGCGMKKTVQVSIVQPTTVVVTSNWFQVDTYDATAAAEGSITISCQ